MNHLSLVLPDERWHPSVVAANAHLFSVSAPNVTGARILEIDCADGGNIISIAASLPSSNCTGVAASSEAVTRGRNLISESGLTNVALFNQITEVEGRFDYIFLRNTYSLQQPESRAELLSNFAGRLSENGIIVVEHLCFPGWHNLNSIRGQIQYHTRDIEDDHERMIAGRQFLQALATSVPHNVVQYKNLVQGAWKSSTGVPDINFGSEYFESRIQPSYFYEFAESLKGSGYQYLSELAPGSMLINQFPQAIGPILPKDCGVIESEQYIDFVTNRAKRVSILCREELKIDRQIDPADCEGLYFSAAGWPENPEQIFQEEETILNSPYGGTVTITVPAAKAALMELCARYPKRLQIGEVVDTVEGIQKELTETDKGAIYEAFAACAVSEIVQINTVPGQASVVLSEKPVASSLVRAQARIRTIPHVSSLQHRTVPVDSMMCSLLEMLDGSHDKQTLVPKLMELVVNQASTLEKEGQQPGEGANVEEFASQQIDKLLDFFQSQGLFEG